MVDDTSDIHSLVHISRLYYEEGFSQKEIAEQLKVSRSLIALYLKRAREQGIVRFSIVDPQDNCEDLALALSEKTNLHRVIVVPSSHSSDTLTRRSIASATARYLESRLQDGDVVGFGWGRTLIEVSELLAPSKPVNIDVVPLLGESGSSIAGSYSQMNQIVMRVAHSFNGRPHFLLAPLLVSSKSLHDDLLKDDWVQPVVEQWEKLTFACMGVGSVPPVQGQVAYIGEEHLASLKGTDAVGDILVHFFDIHGNPVHTPFDDRLIAIEMELLRRTRHVLVAANGVEKASGTIAVLRSGFVNELVIDEHLARALLDALH